MTKNTKPKDLYQEVTDTIIEQLKSGTVPWQKPWNGDNSKNLDLPINHVTGKPYRGINILLLWSSVLKNNFPSSEWASLKQWNSEKKTVKKGEKGNLIIYFDTIVKDVEGEIKKIPFIKSSYVFNRCQLDDWIDETAEVQSKPKDITNKISEVEKFLDSLNLNMEHWDKGACYMPELDAIKIPHRALFIDTQTCTATEGYYSTILHEVTHWSGHKKRLNRMSGKRFGDRDYAYEELVAEFGAAFMCAGFGIATIEKGDHTAYMDYWIKILQENKKLVLSAASDASKAVDFLNTLVPID